MSVNQEGSEPLAPRATEKGLISPQQGSINKNDDSKGISMERAKRRKTANAEYMKYYKPSAKRRALKVPDSTIWYTYVIYRYTLGAVFYRVVADRVYHAAILEVSFLCTFCMWIRRANTTPVRPEEIFSRDLYVNVSFDVRTATSGISIPRDLVQLKKKVLSWHLWY